MYLTTDYRCLKFLSGSISQRFNTTNTKVYHWTPNITRVIKSRMMRWEQHVVHEIMTNEHKILVGKPEGMKPFVRPRHKLVDNIK
jgi:hypothetical protein